LEALVLLLRLPLLLEPLFFVVLARVVPDFAALDLTVPDFAVVDLVVPLLPALDLAVVDLDVPGLDALALDVLVPVLRLELPVDEREEVDRVRRVVVLPLSSPMTGKCDTTSPAVSFTPLAMRPAVLATVDPASPMASLASPARSPSLFMALPTVLATPPDFDLLLDRRVAFFSAILVTLLCKHITVAYVAVNAISVPT
jgi:hypothetical protein